MGDEDKRARAETRATVTNGADGTIRMEIVNYGTLADVMLCLTGLIHAVSTDCGLSMLEVLTVLCAAAQTDKCIQADFKKGGPENV